MNDVPVTYIERNGTKLIENIREDYLLSIQSWTEDMEGYYENNNLEVPQNVDWNFIATMFYVGEIYK